MWAQYILIKIYLYKCNNIGGIIMKKRLVVALSGASGVPLAIDLLQILSNNMDWEVHLVVSSGFQQTLQVETDLSLKDLHQMATKVYDNTDIGASIASGTFKVDGMVIIPCSMKTLAGIATGYSENLILRAADVAIKERRKLILVARESPLSPVHLKNMLFLSQLGVVIMPPMLTYYNHPEGIPQMTRHIVGKVLNEFDIETPDFRRWE